MIFSKEWQTVHTDAKGKPTCQCASVLKMGKPAANGDVNGIIITWEFNLGDIDPLTIKTVPGEIEFEKRHEARLSKDNLEEGRYSRVFSYFFLIHLSTTTGKKSVKLEVSDYVQNIEKNKFESSNEKTYEDSLVVIVMRDKEKAERVVKALKHTVKLCGGKVDPF